MKKHSEYSIQNLLYKWDKLKKAKYKMSNIYMYHNWESDFFFLGKDGSTWELEIKISTNDFNRDFTHKKKKHMLLKEIYEENNRNSYFAPNHFYYCAPEGVVKPEKLPPYAGLIEISADNSLHFKSEVVYLHHKKDEEEDYVRLLEKINDKIYKKSLKDEREFINFRINFDKAQTEEDKDEVFRKFVKKKRI